MIPLPVDGRPNKRILFVWLALLLRLSFPITAFGTSGSSCSSSSSSNGASQLIGALAMATSSDAADANNNDDTQNGDGGDVPRLQAPDPDSNLPSFKLGETIRLEEMGPIITNTDGKFVHSVLCLS